MNRFIKGKESESWYFSYYDFCGIDGFASKVDVAQKSFHILIAFVITIYRGFASQVGLLGDF
jgi:hypothetical protein